MMNDTKNLTQPTSPEPPARLVGRRTALGALGMLIGAVPLARVLTSCGGTTTATTAGAGADAGATTNAGILSSDVPWATGGTSAMKDKASYPNPFASPPTDDTCAMVCALQEGPCYSSQSVEIQDISYGYDGLPLRVYFQVLDESCLPVSGAVVDVWHVTPVGKYSGDDPVNEDVAYCTDNDPKYTSNLYFRGKQTTDENGVVYFDTCFPGWYSLRAIHIHLTISIDKQAYLTTQFGFDDSLNDDIIGTQPIYKDRGPRDTMNDDDAVFQPTTYQKYLFETARMPDGAMLAWKQVIVRSALSVPLCDDDNALPGGGGASGGGFPDGGFPDGGFPGGGGH